MKLFKYFLFVWLLTVATQIGFSQEVENKPVLFDELVDAYCSDYLKIKYDYLAVALQQNPNSNAYIIYHGKDEQEGKNLFIHDFCGVILLIIVELMKTDLSFCAAKIVTK